VFFPKRIFVSLTAEDEIAFEHALRSRGEIQVLRERGPSPESCFVDHLADAPDDETLFIWNCTFPTWKPSFGTVTIVPGAPGHGSRYLSNGDSGPCLRYRRHLPESQWFPIGQIYWPGTLAPQGYLPYDVDEFEKFFDSIAKWIRSVARTDRFRWLPSRRHYYLPDAYAQFVRSGRRSNREIVALPRYTVEVGSKPPGSRK
jgi:hypothetical protein